MAADYLADQLIEIIRRIGDLERRNRNRRRKGTIVAISEDRSRYRVKLSEQEGRPYLTDWLRARTIAAGDVKIDVLYSEGEQVDVVSENGDMTDAMIDFSTYSDRNPRENRDTPLHIKAGNTLLEVSDDQVRIKSGRIILDGEVHLGGEGGQLLHRKGDLDSDGDVATGSASRVYAV